MDKEQMYLTVCMERRDFLTIENSKNYFFNNPFITNCKVKVAELLDLGSARVFLFPQMTEITKADIILS